MWRSTGCTYTGLLPMLSQGLTCDSFQPAGWLVPWTDGLGLGLDGNAMPSIRVRAWLVWFGWRLGRLPRGEDVG
ncbi:hypothetical protein IWX46DRAFT_608964, partial [Phyllosticta citricarpa]